jgi:hypothetical protein
MSSLRSLRRRVAKAIYENTGALRAEWDDLPAERQIGWLSDADLVIPVVIKACLVVIDQKDPEKPSKYLFSRERLSSVIEGLFLGAPDEDWDCPISDTDCTQNCGSYGCGN